MLCEVGIQVGIDLSGLLLLQPRILPQGSPLGDTRNGMCESCGTRLPLLHDPGGPWGTPFDPSLQQLLLLCRQWVTVCGHPIGIVRVQGHQLVKVTLGSITLHKRGSIVSALERCFAGIQAQSALLPLRSVTAHAVGLENRSNVAVEIDAV